ncbi:phage baseplate assembly protein V, partial [Pantoea sp. MHSD4]|uniref:type VI secretion system Vgr family protein n=1 Tax=Pantoea sp. MHSD4 TaxID=2898077 RepID=UPI001E5ECCF0
QGFGGVQIPRVNDEVVVDFINGDPDRPLIIGRVYNEASMPPWALPAAATQMGFLSRSKDGTADTANALRFEDKAGEEHLWIQAQKNMDTHVKNDESHSVLNNRMVSVGANNETRVEGDHTLGTQGNSKTLTTGNRTEQAFASYTIAAGDTVRIECGLSAIELTKEGAINFIGKNFNITVDGNGEINTKGGELHLNPEGGSAAIIAPGSGHKNKIKSEIENYFSSSAKNT